jgi:hypothetical protein
MEPRGLRLWRFNALQYKYDCLIYNGKPKNLEQFLASSLLCPRWSRPAPFPLEDIVKDLCVATG